MRTAPADALPAWALPAGASPGRAGAAPSRLRAWAAAKALAGEAARTGSGTAARDASCTCCWSICPLSPRGDWPDLAAALLRQGEAPALDGEIAARLAEAAAVLPAPDLRCALRDRTALAEVEITAELPGTGRRLLGRIDRLVRQRRTGFWRWISSRTPMSRPRRPRCPRPILRQLGAYVAALRQIFPDTPVDAAMLWTARRG